MNIFSALCAAQTENITNIVLITTQVNINK